MATILEFRPRGSAVSKIGDVADASTSAADQRHPEDVSPSCDIILFTGVRYSRDVPEMSYPAHTDAVDGITFGA